MLVWAPGEVNTGFTPSGINAGFASSGINTGLSPSDKCWVRTKKSAVRSGFFIFAKAKVSALSIVPVSLYG